MSQSVVRVPQEERTRVMRQRLLDATVELVAERGYAATTTVQVAERAGVSRGALLHHFPSKNDLVIAAVEQVMTNRYDDLRAAASTMTGARTRRVLEMLADHFTSSFFMTALDLWVAARTDEVLRAEVYPLEREVGRQTHQLTVDLLGADESKPGVREIIQATLDLVRGLGLASALSDDTERRNRILDQWATVLDAALDKDAPKEKQ